jgi:hypothetical protein
VRRLIGPRDQKPFRCNIFIGKYGCGQRPSKHGAGVDIQTIRALVRQSTTGGRVSVDDQAPIIPLVRKEWLADPEQIVAVSKIGGRRREVSGARRGTASPARAKLLNEAVLENRSHAVGRSSDKRTLLRVGRGQPVGLYAPLHWRGCCAARPSTARLLWVGSQRSPLLLSVIKPSAFIDAFRSCPLGLHRLASAESGAHWGLAMRAHDLRRSQSLNNNVETIL